MSNSFFHVQQSVNEEVNIASDENEPIDDGSNNQSLQTTIVFVNV